jgi:hypothetical protein
VSSRHTGWRWRLVWSGVLAAAAVTLSTLLVLAFSTEASMSGDIAAYAVGIPLLPGLGFVSVFWGSWQAFHQGRILALIPLSSGAIDTLFLFVVWEFFHGVRSRELAPDNSLHVN